MCEAFEVIMADRYKEGYIQGRIQTGIQRSERKRSYTRAGTGLFQRSGSQGRKSY